MQLDLNRSNYEIANYTGGKNGSDRLLYEMQEETRNERNNGSYHEEWPQSDEGQVFSLRHRDVQNPR